jgi:hypothetical protein
MRSIYPSRLSVGKYKILIALKIAAPSLRNRSRRCFLLAKILSTITTIQS